MITDVRINRLCAGLLVSDEKKRWNGAQVREWLAGRSPDVPDRRVPIEATEFEFDGQTFRDPETLSVALAGNWRLAARRYGISPSPSWTALTTWLHQFDQPGQYPTGVVERRLDLLGQLEQSTEKPDAKLLRLLAGLNPKQPPIFRQLHIDVPKLRELARQAQDGAEADPGRRAREIVDELWDARLLGVLARFDGAGELSRVDARWQSAVRTLRAVTVELARDPRLTAAVSGAENRTAIRAALLEFAAWPARGEDWLREIAERERALPVPVAWYNELLDRVGTDPVRAYGVLLASGVARAEAQQIVMAHEAAAQARRARERTWQDHERRRLGRRGRAQLRALAGATVLAALWFVLLLFAARTPQLWLVLVAMVTHYAAELWLARTLGADYHPGFSLWQGMGEASGRVGGRLRGAPRAWALGIIALLVVLGSVTWLLPLAAVLAGLGHLGWAIARHRRWSQGHDRDRRRTLAQ